MDWNWFFSSIAQSAAAIVGIFGAFIITKVLSNQAKFGEKSIRFRSLRTDAIKLVDSAHHLSFAWYIRLNRKYELEKAEEFLEKDDDLTPDALYAKLNFPPFIPRADAIKDIQDLKDRRAHAAVKERQRLADAARNQAELQKIPGMSGLKAFMAMDGGNSARFVDPILPAALLHPRPYAELRKERDAIDALAVEIRHHRRTIVDFLATTSSNPESSMAITWALAMVAGLFLIGVIYPLSFLPTPTPWAPALEFHGFWARVFSLRGMLLTAISVIFLAALTMFAVMNRRLRYPLNEVKALADFAHIGTYSRYYAIAEKNEEIAQEQAARDRRG
ncbi:MAG: hypothetical protein ABS82_02750 [Rhodanobacter sp. SCN 67-45]|nr:MAG: hypothetical protein ABS82_02750 [Rhodanobacter sp. SCN 67-45]